MILYRKKYNLLQIFSISILTLIASFNLSDERGLILIIGLLYLYILVFLVNKKFPINLNSSRLLIFFVIWLIYGLTQFLFVAQTPRTIGHLQSLVFGILIILLMSRVINSKESLGLLYKMWGIGVLLTIFFAWWEIVTGNHLPSSGALTYNLKNTATVGYFNPNDYSFFLIISLPVIFYWIQQRFIYNFFGLFMLFSSFYIVFVNESRLGLILFFILVCVFLNNIFKTKNKKLILLFSIVLGAVFIINIDIISQSIFGISTLQGYDSSTYIRGNLMDSALQIFANNPLGVGAGNLELYMPIVGYKVHNFWIEILVNYGIIIFAGLIILFLVSINYHARNKNKETKEITKPIFWSMITFLPASVMSSSIFQFPLIWFLFGLIICANTIIKNNKNTYLENAVAREEKNKRKK